MSNLFLLRHLKSQWNLDNRFAGWVDNPLSKEGREQAKDIASTLINVHKLNIDVIYSASLVRCTETVLRVFDHIIDKYPLFVHLDGGKMQTWGNFTDISQNDLPVYVTQALNERHYGQFQGLDKAEAIKKHGEEAITRARRGYLDKPPGGESLKDVYKRTTPFFKKYVEKDLSKGKNVLVVGSHNSLRAVVKYIENISDNDIANVELPFGALMKYEFEISSMSGFKKPGRNVVLKSKKYFVN